MRALILLGSVGLAGAAACERRPPPPPLEQLVQLQARSDDGTPLQGAELLVAGQLVGQTDGRGVVATLVRGRPGTMVEVWARCPATDQRPAEERRTIALRPTRALDEPAPAPLSMSLSCQPTARRAAVVLKARPDLPVLLMGREVARTDRDGVAHVLLRLLPNSTFRLVLDTSAQPRLRPASPARSFTLADADDVFLFEQPFELQPLPPRKKKPPPPKAPRPTAILGAEK